MNRCTAFTKYPQVCLEREQAHSSLTSLGRTAKMQKIEIKSGRQRKQGRINKNRRIIFPRALSRSSNILGSGWQKRERRSAAALLVCKY